MPTSENYSVSDHLSSDLMGVLQQASHSNSSHCDRHLGLSLPLRKYGHSFFFLETKENTVARCSLCATSKQSILNFKSQFHGHLKKLHRASWSVTLLCDNATKTQSSYSPGMISKIWVVQGI